MFNISQKDFVGDWEEYYYGSYKLRIRKKGNGLKVEFIDGDKTTTVKNLSINRDEMKFTAGNISMDLFNILPEWVMGGLCVKKDKAGKPVETLPMVFYKLEPETDLRQKE